MAIAATIGKTASNASATTTLAFAATAITAAQDIVVAVALADATKTVTGIADTAGNTFALRSAVNGTGVRTEVWEAQAVKPNAADIITITFSGATLAAAAFEEYSGGTPQSVFSPLPMTVSNIVPHDLTSNSSHPPFVVSASSEYSGARGAWGALSGTYADGNDWLGTGNSVDWWKVDIGAGNTKVLGAYRIVFPVNPSPIYGPKDWKMQGSNDNSTWDDLHTVVNDPTRKAGEVALFFCSVTTTAYRYFRLNITANHGGTPYVQVIEISLYEYASPQLVEPGVTADSVYDINRGACIMVGLGSYLWTSTNTAPPHWLDLDLGRARTFDTLAWSSYPDGASGGQPYNWEVYVSSDGVTWGSAVGSGSWGDYWSSPVTRYAAFASQTARWVRFKWVDQSWGDNGSGRFNYASGQRLTVGAMVPLSAQQTATGSGSGLAPHIGIAPQEQANWAVAAFGFVCNSGDTLAARDGTLRQSVVPALTTVGVALVDNVGSAGALTLPLSARLSTSRAWAAAGVELRSGGTVVAPYLDYTGHLPITGNAIDREMRFIHCLMPALTVAPTLGSGPSAHGWAY